MPETFLVFQCYDKLNWSARFSCNHSILFYMLGRLFDLPYMGLTTATNSLFWFIPWWSVVWRRSSGSWCLWMCLMASIYIVGIMFLKPSCLNLGFFEGVLPYSSMIFSVVVGSLRAFFLTFEDTQCWIILDFISRSMSVNLHVFASSSVVCHNWLVWILFHQSKLVFFKSNTLSRIRVVCESGYGFL